ncbi:transposon Tf2-6 polyprotein [Elysia marginata]|uniref:Transposon Tf2-6 polyprotein n=1 Tax=Elysia marginata TaxID=1093978 RepID=A0AAV4H0L2_9GAST|nr:transposon Tf2-6 polyprotein [Elysia marginata]
MIISGKTNQEHHDNLYRVLQRLEEHGLRANYEKCSFYQDQVVFCGIKVTKDGLHQTIDKVKAVQDAPIPCNKTQLRSFLGLVNYYHKWLQNIAQITKLLYDLLQDNQFQWSKSCQTLTPSNPWLHQT